jgi:hypothetical protein
MGWPEEDVREVDLRMEARDSPGRDGVRGVQFMV